MGTEKALRRIALDLDSVLADTMHPFIEELSRIKKTQYRKDDIKNWNIDELFGITRLDVLHILNFIWNDDNWERIPPTEDFLGEKVNALKKYGKVDILTVIPENQVENSKKWLVYHGIPYDNYVRVPEGMKKSDFDYDVFIDDSLSNAEDIANSGRTVFLYDQPWNRKATFGIRIRSLSEVTRYLKKT